MSEPSWLLVYISGQLCCSLSCSALINDLHDNLKCYCSLHLRGTWVVFMIWVNPWFPLELFTKDTKIYQTQLMFTAELVLRAQQAHHLWAQSPWGTLQARWGACSHQDSSSCPQLWSGRTGHSGQRKLNPDTKISSQKVLKRANHWDDDQRSPSWVDNSTFVLSYNAWLSRIILRSCVA